jgi:amidohydrolase
MVEGDAGLSAPDSSTTATMNLNPAPDDESSPPPTAAWEGQLRQRVAAVEKKLLGWRHEIHQHPELGDRETRTSKLVADHLRSLGMEVRTGIARTGVVGVLKGGKPGPTIALRADMDALPMKELVNLPFASKDSSQTLGSATKVPVMHSCGHDTHTAMLMATAEVLAGMKADLPGTVIFLFQPSEEGSSKFSATSGKSWGAKLMLEEGVFKQYKPAAVFGMHVLPGKLGQIFFRGGPTLASGDALSIRITGKQGHGGMPWNTIDPVVTSALIITDLQTIVSRRANLITSPAAVTVGMIHGGSSGNVVPEMVQMDGTLRSYDEGVRALMKKEVPLIVQKVAESMHAKADVKIVSSYDVTVNNQALARRMVPVLRKAADGNLRESPQQGASEDFSYYAEATPGLFIFMGITPAGKDPAKAAPNHNPSFFVDEKALIVGVRAMSSMAMSYLTTPPTKAKAKP